MNYFLLGSAALIAAIVLYQFVARGGVKTILKNLRWYVGGGTLVLAAILALARSFALATVVATVGAAILARGRIGPIDFDAIEVGDQGEEDETVSTVTSRFFAMALNHDTGEVAGKVVSGKFAGADLIELGEIETRELMDEVSADADSLALLESWLDANRSGWREWFAAHPGPGQEPAGVVDEVQQAYEILGLAPGATPEEIRDAHHRLMKGVHPDQGGSTFLAAEINQAKDLLLRKHQKRV